MKQTGALALLARYLRAQRARVAGLAAVFLLIVALPLANPQIVRAFVDGAIGGSPLRTLLWLAGAYIAIACVIEAGGLATTYLSELVGWTATNRLREDLSAHVLRLDMPFHNRRTPGEMIERVDGDVTALSNFFSQLVLNVLWSALMLVGVLVLVFREDWRVGLALTGYSVLAFAALHRLRAIAVPYATANREASAGMFGFLEERLSGVEDIRANGAGNFVMRGFHGAVRNLYRTSLRSERVWAGGLWTPTQGLFVAGYVMTMAMGAWLHATGSASVGTVYLLFQYVHMLKEPLEVIGDQLRELQKAGAGVERVHELFATHAEIVDPPEASRLPLPQGPLGAGMRDVSFGYFAGEDVLSRVSFDLAPGCVLGLLGRTGSGKTTLARLLLRLYETDRGVVSVGSCDVRRVAAEDLRRRVGYVTQDVQLFGASVRDNLTLFSDGIDDARIEAALRELGLGAWFDRLPNGLDSVLASGGTGLSAGEAQLVAFARVFLRDPGLVILDEASSRLDPATERAIELAVDRLLAGRTGILIAHRLSTVHRANEILILENGSVSEHGERAALEADPRSRFAGLLRTGLEEVLA